MKNWRRKGKKKMMILQGESKQKERIWEKERGFQGDGPQVTATVDTAINVAAAVSIRISVERALK
ncbi:hypothetical protein COLO4_05718 [Corchorus olitorius]|uniref:Uncharacterized protein n=1 Tax=Corchorus olitorius TaxID=93759 RepID=A0A1R3KQ39_9ROSI|nr:hypothetical protein COLO4_05718 [Corchorus olitorius]